jgi:hypothetical protein
MAAPRWFDEVEQRVGGFARGGVGGFGRAEPAQHVEADRGPCRPVPAPPVLDVDLVPSGGKGVQQCQEPGQVFGGDQAVAAVEAVQERGLAALPGGRVVIMVGARRP